MSQWVINPVIQKESLSQTQNWKRWLFNKKSSEWTWDYLQLKFMVTLFKKLGILVLMFDDS